MSVWMNFDWTSVKINSFEFSEYLERVRERIGLMNWKDNFTDAVKQFFTVAKEEHEHIEQDTPS